MKIKDYISINNDQINENQNNLIEEDKNTNKNIINYNIYKKLLFIFGIFIILLCSFDKNLISFNKEFSTKNNKNNDEVIIPNNEDIYRQENFDSREKAFKKAKNFLKSNMEGKLLQKIPSESINDTIASAVIPVYNSIEYISRAIKSIQNQNISNIEIILVNDFSTDNTLSFIEEIQRGDPRIKIINNKKNMGILYTRCIGVLNSKGRYIFPLDNDDMFLDNDVFFTMTNIADKGYFDIVEFKGIFSRKGGKDILNNKRTDTLHTNRPLNLVIYQPELGDYLLWPKKKINDYYFESCYLWGKCIRTEIYKKAIYKLGEERYSRHMIKHEDILMNYALFNTARSYKFVGKYGIFYIYRQSSASREKPNFNMDIYHIYLLDVALIFVKDNVKNKRILVNLAMYVLSIKKLREILKKNNYLKNLFYSCIERVLSMTKISDKLKNEIRKKGKELKLIN